MSDLDDRIRDLVARAAADAPPPPPIDESAVITRHPTGDGPRRGTRWLVGGLAGLSAAAALVAIVWVASDDVAEEPFTPVAPSTTAPATAPPTGGSMPDTTPDSSVVDVPTPTAPAPTDPPTTSTAPPVGAPDGDVVRAGPEGVVAVSVDGTVDVVTTEPMAVAFRVPDGRVFVQRSSDNRDPDADTTVWLFEPGSTELIGQPMPTPELASAPLRLHDVAVVDGEVVLLIESGPGRCVGFDDCDGSLWALRADSGELDLILTQSMWEAGFGRLHLAETGQIVGESFAEVLSMPFSAVVPGSSAEPVDFAALGLEEQYADCSTCPTAFSIDRTGSAIAWIERATDDRGVVVQSVVVLTTVDGTAGESLPVTDDLGAPVDQLVPVPWLELVHVTLGDPGGWWMIVNAGPDTGLDPVAPIAIDLDAGIVTPTGFAPGTIVTAG